MMHDPARRPDERQGLRGHRRKLGNREGDLAGPGAVRRRDHSGLPDKARGEAALAEVSAVAPAGGARLEIADLSSLPEVRELAGWPAQAGSMCWSTMPG